MIHVMLFICVHGLPTQHSCCTSVLYVSYFIHTLDTHAMMASKRGHPLDRCLDRCAYTHLAPAPSHACCTPVACLKRVETLAAAT